MSISDHLRKFSQRILKTIVKASRSNRLENSSVFSGDLPPEGGGEFPNNGQQRQRRPSAQRGYYELRSARSVLSERVQAIAASMPAQSVILDIGCNDGSISAKLIDLGKAKKSYCIDLENILTHSRAGMEFIEADILSLNIEDLPEANGVLLLNVLHHLIRRSPSKAVNLLNSLLARYEFVFVDIGSFSEEGDRGWIRAYRRRWSSDAEMWSTLFEKAAWRFKLLRYPAQGGHRVLWKLYGQPYELTKYSLVERYVKTPGSWPDNKALVPIGISEDLSERSTSGVVFEKIISDREDLFWVKRYLGLRHAIVVELEYKIWNAASAALFERKNKSGGAYREISTYQLVPFPGDNAVCAIYEPELINTATVHFQDWVKFFDASETHQLSAFGAAGVQFENFRRVKIIHLCDFQAAKTWDGIKLIDFEPNIWVRHFMGRTLKREKNITDNAL
jgi:hypothetical protein